MNLTEFRSKWRTNEIEEVDMLIVCNGTEHTIKMPRNVHSAPLGDFLDEYISHIKTPRWRRDSDWKYVKNRMKDALNYIILEWVA